MDLNILIEGKAGHGPNTIAKLLGGALAKAGYSVFISRDYGSVIRGGHNFNLLSISDRQIMSNPAKFEVLVSLDKDLGCIPEAKPSRNLIELKSSGESNVYVAGKLAKLLNMDFKLLEDELKRLKNFKENLEIARKGYSEGKSKFDFPTLKNKFSISDGAKSSADGAIASGMDIYYAYPMTPSTSLLFELADRQIEKNYFVYELENETSVMNAAIGSAITGAKTMIGTAGGGFDLMTEALTLSGMAEIPIVAYLAQRPGPATGVPTYTSQGDLKMALGAGHGEFSRLVIAPGDPVECAELTSQAFYFSQKFKIPAIILTDKHLAESVYSLSSTPQITPSEKLTTLKKYNSYEHTKEGYATEDSAIIKSNFERRMKVQKEIEQEAEKFSMFKIFGNKTSRNAVLFWGSTKGAVLDAMADINAKFIQVLYLEPFPKKLKEEIEKSSNIIVVENNATSPLSSLIAEKTGILIDDKNKILRYDGRPFFSDKLREELKRRIR